MKDNLMTGNTIEDNLTKVTTRLKLAVRQANRQPSDVCLLAVSKTRPAEDLRQAFSAGQSCFGENYLQEALEKQQQLNDLDIEWHFIGPIQSNKTRNITESFDWVHSVDRLKVARRLSEQRDPQQAPLNICLQVNIDNEDSKSGVTFNELPALAQAIAELPQLQLRGLMAIPAPRDSAEEQQQALTQLRDALTQLQALPGLEQLDTLSMGMSRDMEAAIAAGSTMVRVGTDIFGPRVPPATKS